MTGILIVHEKRWDMVGGWEALESRGRPLRYGNVAGGTIRGFGRKAFQIYCDSGRTVRAQLDNSRREQIITPRRHFCPLQKSRFFFLLGYGLIEIIIISSRAIMVEDE